MSRQPKLAETSPGEVRTICHGCSRVISSRSIWCAECKETQGKYCEQCGKSAYVSPCRDCTKQPPKRLGKNNREMVERLWSEGLSAKKIAEQIGSRTKYPGTMITHARKRGWDLPHRRPDMIERGNNLNKRMRNLQRSTASDRMRQSDGVSELVKQNGASSEGVRAAVERMWAEGFTAREICENVGWTSGSSAINKARKRGWNLPYRQPENVESGRAKFIVLNEEKRPGGR